MAKYDNEYEDTMSGGADACDEYFEPTVQKACKKLVSMGLFDDDEENEFEDSQAKYDEVFANYEDD